MADYRKMWEELGMDVELQTSSVQCFHRHLEMYFYRRKTVRILWTIIIW